MTNKQKIFYCLATALFLMTTARPVSISAKGQNLVMVSIQNQNIADKKAVISWETNLPAVYIFRYGTSKDYQFEKRSSLPRSKHTVYLDGLQPKTLYHFQITAYDNTGRRTMSFDQIFRTGAFKDTEKPRLLDLRIPAVTGREAYLYMKTNEKVSATVFYQPANQPNKKRKKNFSSNNEGAAETTIKSLQPSNAYTYYVEIKDKAGNQTRTGLRRFSTTYSNFSLANLEIKNLAPLDTGSPLVQARSSTVTFTTSVLAYCELRVRGPKEFLGRKFKGQKLRAKNHAFYIEKLKPNTTYEYRISCWDWLNRKITAPYHTFATKGPKVLGFEASDTDDKPFAGTKFQLVKTPLSPRIYAVVGGQKYYIRNLRIFSSCGFYNYPIKIISQKELAIYPDIRLIKQSGEKDIYYLYKDKNLKKKILNNNVNMSYAYNRARKPLTICDTDFFEYPNLFLIKTPNDPTVYYIKDNIKRPVYSWDALVRQGWQKWQIGEVNQVDLDSYDTGPVFK